MTDTEQVTAVEEQKEETPPEVAGEGTSDQAAVATEAPAKEAKPRRRRKPKEKAEVVVGDFESNDLTRGAAAELDLAGVERVPEYLSFARRVPVFIRVHGLGVTLAYLKSRKDAPGARLLVQHLSRWVAKQCGVDRDDLLHGLMHGSSRLALHASHEAATYARALICAGEQRGAVAPAATAEGENKGKEAVSESNG